MEIEWGCGMAYGQYSMLIGKTLSVVPKYCSLINHAFSHELGHNFGADHNNEASNQPQHSIPYARGHLLESSHPKGFRTIMSYRNGKNNLIPINYFSNPKVIYPGSGSPTGVENASNNK